MSATATPAMSIRTIATHVAVPFAIGIVMALSYLGGFHKPDPNGLRIDVVGSGVQTAMTVGQLQRDLGDAVSVRAVDTIDDARSAIEHREITAAFAPGEAQPTLMVSTAAGDPAAVTTEKIFSEITLAHNQPLRIADVVPADPERDPSGQSLFFVLVALTVGSYGTGIAIAVAAAGRSIGVRVLLAVVASVLTAAVITAIAAFGFDALPGAQWSIFGISIPYSLATMLFAVGLHPLIGRFTTFAMVTIFVGLNFTSSGGVFGPQLQPKFFGVLHDFWIGAGFNESARDLAYFPLVGVGGEIGKIMGWLVVSAALVGVAGVVEKRRRTAAAESGRHERGELSPSQQEELAEDVVA